jgi:hypothetical protein
MKWTVPSIQPINALPRIRHARLITMDSGMKMTEWACRSLLGLGQTEHLELGGPVPVLADRGQRR